MTHDTHRIWGNTLIEKTKPHFIAILVYSYTLTLCAPIHTCSYVAWRLKRERDEWKRETNAIYSYTLTLCTPILIYTDLLLAHIFIYTYYIHTHTHIWHYRQDCPLLYAHIYSHTRTTYTRTLIFDIYDKIQEREIERKRETTSNIRIYTCYTHILTYTYYIHTYTHKWHLQQDCPLLDAHVRSYTRATCTRILSIDFLTTSNILI